MELLCSVTSSDVDLSDLILFQVPEVFVQMQLILLAPHYYLNAQV